MKNRVDFEVIFLTVLTTVILTKVVNDLFERFKQNRFPASK